MSGEMSGGGLVGGMDLFALGRNENQVQRWVWADRIPLGEVTILEGPPGVGKSLLSLEIAARRSRHGHDQQMDAEHLREAGFAGYDRECTTIFTTEDSLEGVIVPRLKVAYGYLSRVSTVGYVTVVDQWGRQVYRRPTFDDLGYMEDAIEATGAALVIFDPVLDYLGAKQRLTSARDMRALVDRLATLATACDCAILLISHPTTRSTSGLLTAARAGLAIIPCPEEPTRERLVVVTKSNLGPPAPTLRFRITTLAELEVAGRAPAWVARKGGARQLETAPCIEWLGPYEGGALQRASVSASPAARDRQTVMGDAMAFLREALRQGPRPATEVTAEAGAVGIGVDTLQRARARLGIRPRRAGFGRGGQWVWALNEQQVASADDERADAADEGTADEG